MIAVESMLGQVVPFLLVVCRVSGLMLLSPLLTSRAMPRRYRAMLAVMLGAALFAGLPASARVAPGTDVFTLLPLVVSELLIGGAMGFIASIPVLSLDMAGYLMGHQMGLGLARVYSPEMGTDADVMGQMLMFIGLAAFVAMGGLETLFVTLASTFERVPIGAFGVDRLAVEPVVGVVAGGFELALRVAAPVMCIILLLMIALGAVMKSMPQVNVMSVGFTIKILCGIAVLAASLVAIHETAWDEVRRVSGMVMEWGRSVR